jgi:predicted nucleic acid-binding protein
VGEVWVVNSSPTILLGKIQQLDLLPGLCEKLVIPQGVVDEIMNGPNYDPARFWLSQSGHGFISPDVPIPAIVANWDLGIGETHVISWCLANPGCEAILDDGAARRCAKTLGIPMTGTLGVLMRAKKHGRISAIAPLIQKLMENGFRIDGKTLDYVLNWADEMF